MIWVADLRKECELGARSGAFSGAAGMKWRGARCGDGVVAIQLVAMEVREGARRERWNSQVVRGNW